MKRELFIKGNPIILGFYLLDEETQEHHPVKFRTNGATKVNIYIGEQCITDNGVTTEFSNDDGKLTIHRNDFDITPGVYECIIRVEDLQHPSPGQVIAHPALGHLRKVILEAA